MLTLKRNKDRGQNEYDVFQNGKGKIGEIGPMADGLGDQCFRSPAATNYSDLSADEWAQVSSFLRGTKEH